MGRRKIEIKAIKDDRNRSVTFLKRKGGLFKKAHELSVLCSVDVAVFIFGNNKKLYEYSSTDMRELIGRYQYHGGPNEHKGPGDYNGGNDDDDDDEGDGTPPRGSDPGHEVPMMPPQFHGQGPAPFPQMRQHEPSASPPVPNGTQFPGGHPGHVSRGHTPQPGGGSRPGSRNDVRRVANMAPPPGPHGAMGYMPNHQQMYNGPPQPGMMAQHPSQQFYPPQHPQQQHPQQHPQHHPQQHPQQGYVDDRRQGPPPAFGMQPQHAMPGPPRPDQQTMQQPPMPQSIPQTRISPPPPPERRLTDPQAPSIKPEGDRPQPPLLNTDAAIKKLQPRKGHSIFTPIEENKSILSQHLASFAEQSHAKGEAPRSQSADAGRPGTSPPQTRSQAAAETGRNSAAPTTSDAAFPPPPSRNNSLPTAGGARPRGPRLTVQIPADGASEGGGSATGESNSPRNPSSTPTTAPRNSVVLPPPSPSASALLSAGATGPPNPFARPLPTQPVNETPMSALPSRFLSTDFLPSPSSFYPDWNLRSSTDNAPASPLNFATPVVTSGPSFLRDDPYHPPSSMKRKSDTGPSPTVPEMQTEPKRTKVE